MAWTIAQPSTVGAALIKAADTDIGGDPDTDTYAIKVTAYRFDWNPGKFVETTGDGDFTSKFLHSGTLYGQFALQGVVVRGTDSKIGIANLTSSTIMVMTLYLSSTDQVQQIRFLVESIRISAAKSGSVINLTIVGRVTDMEGTPLSAPTAALDPETAAAFA